MTFINNYSKKNTLLLIFLSFTLGFSCYPKIVTLPKSPKIVHTIISNEKIFPINNGIKFSGYNWIVSNSPDKKTAPGNNYWSNKNVWLDEKGQLHLVLTKDAEHDKWFCAEIRSEEKFKYGTYKFWIDGRVDKLDKNVVFGLFNYSGVDFFDEIDIEFSRWGDATHKNLHYTVYPNENTTAKSFGVSKEIKLKDSFSLHQITRTTTSLKFESFYDLTKGKTHSKKFNSSNISTKAMPIYINLWCFKNMPPSDQTEVEIVIQKFEFID